MNDDHPPEKVVESPLSQARRDEWQRVLDGSADVTCENEIVLLCEAEPSRYRDLALEMIEQRRIARAMKLAAGPAVAPAFRSQRSHPFRLVGLATAAMIGGIVASLAWNLMDDRSGPTPERSLAANATDQSSPKTTNPQRPYELTVLSDGSDESWIEPWTRPAIPIQARQTLRSAGIEVQENADIYWLRDERGKPYAFPHRNIELRYIPTALEKP